MLLRHDKKESIAYITLANPEKRNALSREMLGELAEAMTMLNNEVNVKVIVIQSEGSVFCAGADLKYLQQIREKDGLQNLEDSRFFMQAFQTVYTSPKIVIAKVQGDAIAGGSGLATVCDFVIASDTARFGFTEVAIGFVPAIVGVYLQRKIGEAKSRHLLLTADIISAHEAQLAGIVYKVVEAEQLDDAVEQLAQRLAKHPSSSIQLTKKLLVNVHDTDVISGLDYATTINALSRSTQEFKDGTDRIINRISGGKSR